MSHSHESGLTLVELVIAIAVVVLLTGIAVPTIDGVQRERVAREPVNELYRLARDVRLRAMREQRPYQIVFLREGFRASRFFNPYGGREEFDNLKTELDLLEQRQAMIDASQARGINLSSEESDPKLDQLEEGIRYFAEYDVSEGIDYSLKFWDDTQWVSMRGETFRRWVFQPSGMCEPMKIRVESDGSFFEIEFHPLTADIKSERSWVE